ncbi:MAG: hypothetical protein IIY21_02445 [Clostridiales bacterium]|nr:hypothetical protein [Clostridiales bacterium]
MSVTITFYNFSKRINETLQPSGGTTVQCVLKEPTDFESPSFIVTGNHFEYTYAKWGTHYYFVTGVKSLGANRCEVSLDLDPMATYKAQIGNTSAYVLYAQSDFNKWIRDERMSMSHEMRISQGGFNIFTNGSGSIVITVAGNNQNGMLGFTAPYGIQSAAQRSLIDYFYSDDIVEDLKKFFNSPYDCIIEAHYIPWDCCTGSAATEIDEIMLGTTRSECEGWRLKDKAMNAVLNQQTIALNFPYDDFRAFSPYSRLDVFLPYIGTVEVDIQKTMIDDNLPSSMIVAYSLDPISGEIFYAITCGAYKQTFTANCAVSLSIGQTQSDAFSGAMSIGLGVASAAVGVASGGAAGIAGAVVGGVSGISNGVANIFKDETISKSAYGAFASGSAYRNSTLGRVTVVLSTMEASQSPASMAGVAGRPLFETRRIGTLSGYVQCSNASVSITGTERSRERINSMLNSGFYYT